MGFFLLLLFSVSVSVAVGQTLVTVPPPPEIETISVKHFEQEFYEEFKSYLATRNVSPRLAQMKQVIQDTSLLISINELPLAVEPHTCLTCRAVSHAFLSYNLTESSETNKLSAVALDLCNLLSLNVRSLCEGKIATFTPTIDYILRNTTEIDADRVCSIYYQHLNCAESDRLAREFPVNFPVPAAPKESKSASTVSSSAASPLVIVHLSDFHFDPYYTPGADAHCEEGICCRRDQGFPNDTRNAAGFWGDYRACDSPWHTVEDIVSRVKKEYKQIDLIYYTGDTVDHFGWKTSIEHNSASIRRMTEYFKQEFPGIPLYPVLGNHEGHPTNSFSPPYAIGTNVSSQWLFDLIHDQWGPLLPEDSRETLRSGGHYSVEVKPKLRLIAINSNFCYHSNLWLFHSLDYFADQLQWFRNELAKATENEEKVHVISHIPTNDMLCFVAWAREYRKIVEEFSETIVAVFNGHTHEDEFNVYYSIEDPTKATGVAFNGGSGTTFAFFNSNFKAYFVDPETFEVLDYDTWHYNLTEANLSPNHPPRWEKTYSFKEAYNLTDLSPKSMDGLVQRLATDRNLLRTYWERKEKYSDYLLKEGCDESCLRKNFCDIVTMVHGDNRKCDSLYPKVGGGGE